MATDYKTWSVVKLEKEKAKIDKAIELNSGKQRKDLIAKIKTMAASGGIELSELIAQGAKSAPVRKKRKASKKKTAGKRVAKKSARSKKRGKVAQIYRNPDDHSVTWSGRGRPPRWVSDHVASGGDKEDLRF